MRPNVITRGAQNCAEKVLMSNVLACTAVITAIEKVQELSFNGAVKCRSSRMRINPEQAAKELTDQHNAVCAKAKAGADRIKSMLSRKKDDVAVKA